jgi:2,5-diketo-D-gluconate reductase B
VEGLLARLGICKLDLLYVHAPWDGIPMEEYILGLSDSVAAGLADRIGLSNFNLEQLQQAVRICPTPICAVQIHCTMRTLVL